MRDVLLVAVLLIGLSQTVYANSNQQYWYNVQQQNYYANLEQTNNKLAKINNIISTANEMQPLVTQTLATLQAYQSANTHVDGGTEGKIENPNEMFSEGTLTKSELEAANQDLLVRGK